MQGHIPFLRRHGADAFIPRQKCSQKFQRKFLRGFLPVVHQPGDENALHHRVHQRYRVAAVVEVEHADFPIRCAVEVAVAQVALGGAAGKRRQGRQCRLMRPAQHEQFLRFPALRSVHPGQHLFQHGEGEQIILPQRVKQHRIIHMAALPSGNFMGAGMHAANLTGRVHIDDLQLSLHEILHRHLNFPAPDVP